MHVSRQLTALVLPLLLVCVVQPRRLRAHRPQRPGQRAKPARPPPLGPKRCPIELKLSDKKLSGDGALILPDTFDVFFVNHSDGPLQIWNPNFKQGWCGLSFRLTDLATGQQHVIRRRPVADLRRKEFAPPVPHAPGERITMPRVGEYTCAVLLSDCEHSERDWLGIPKAVYGQRFSFTARFESPPNSRAAKESVWVGAIESPSQTVRVVDWQPQSPHYYLEHGFPQKALEVLKSDRFWISRHDEKSGDTPLHAAALGNGYPEVVKWLLDQGADVNALANNNCTPLRGAANPEVIALILAKHPDLSIEDSSTGAAVLRDIADAWARTRNPDERRRWQTLMDMYMKAGAVVDIQTAIRLNDLERVKAILAKSPQLAHEQKSGSLLRLAASLGRLDICRYLVERFHVDVNEFEAGHGYPVSMEALAYPEIVRLLINSGADLKTRITLRDVDEHGGLRTIGDDATLLHYAAADGVPETIQILIDNGVDIFASASYSPRDRLAGGKREEQTALEVACMWGKTANAAVIVQHPKFRLADLKRRKQVLDRCLACWRMNDNDDPPVERWRLVKMLLDCGANPNAKVGGVTAIQRAAQAIWSWGETGPFQKRGRRKPTRKSTCCESTARCARPRVCRRHGQRGGSRPLAQARSAVRQQPPAGRLSRARLGRHDE